MLVYVDTSTVESLTAGDIMSLARHDVAREREMEEKGDLEEDIDVLATQRVVNRAMLSSVLAFFGVFGAYASSFVLSPLVSMGFLLIVLGVAVSCVRTLVHPDAFVTGGIRWLGVALGAAAALGAVLALAAFAFALVRSM